MHNLMDNFASLSISKGSLGRLKVTHKIAHNL